MAEQSPSEKEPNYDKVSFIDEYPELAKKVWLRRLARERQLGVTVLPRVIKFQPKKGTE
jgi:hypothetical protein